MLEKLPEKLPKKFLDKKQIAILIASPRKNGSSATLATFFQNALNEYLDNTEQTGTNLNFTCTVKYLTDYEILPCQACDSCLDAPHSCILAKSDASEMLFEWFFVADLVIIFAPIHFYALPAKMQALIERAQRFWNARQKHNLPIAKTKFASAGLVAARTKGEHLFSGAMYSLKYFFASIGRELQNLKTWSGIENALSLDNKAKKEVETWVRQLAKVLESNY